MHYITVLDLLGFKPIEENSNIYKNPNLGNFDFDFSSKQNVESIAACIWDVAQHYGEKKREKEIIGNICR